MPESPSDLVSRLLAAIQEREDRANDSKVARNTDEWVVADQPPPAWGDATPDPVVLAGGKPIMRLDDEYGGSFHADHAVLNGPRSVLRLCQAHRKIIDRHSSQHVHVLAFDGGHFCGDCGTDASECTRRGVMVCQTCGMEPCGTLLALAEGYGIEAGS